MTMSEDNKKLDLGNSGQPYVKVKNPNLGQKCGSDSSRMKVIYSETKDDGWRPRDTVLPNQIGPASDYYSRAYPEVKFENVCIIQGEELSDRVAVYTNGKRKEGFPVFWEWFEKNAERYE